MSDGGRGVGRGGWGKCDGYSRGHLSVLAQSFLSPGYLSVLAYLLSSRFWLTYFSVLAQ